MSSIRQKMATMPRISIDGDNGFVAEIKNNGVVMAEVIVSFQAIEFDVKNNKSKVKLSAYNPDFPEDIQVYSHQKQITN